MPTRMSNKRKEVKISLNGEMTIYTCNEMKIKLMEAVSKDCNVTINVSNVTEMDTAGLQLLILVKNELMQNDFQLMIIGKNESVTGVMNICNMSEYFSYQENQL